MHECEETENEFGFRITGLKYLEVLVYNTSGTIRREELISDWYMVKLSDGSTREAYHHKLFGWMQKGGPEGLFIYGYVPLITVTNWWRKY